MFTYDIRCIIIIVIIINILFDCDYYYYDNRLCPSVSYVFSNQSTKLCQEQRHLLVPSQTWLRASSTGESPSSLPEKNPKLSDQPSM